MNKSIPTWTHHDSHLLIVGSIFCHNFNSFSFQGHLWTDDVIAESCDPTDRRPRTMMKLWKLQKKIKNRKDESWPLVNGKASGSNWRDLTWSTVQLLDWSLSGTYCGMTLHAIKYPTRHLRTVQLRWNTISSV